MDLGEGHGRDLVIAITVVGGILLALYLYTGTWPPPVVVESNSMMHVDKAQYQQGYGDTRAEDVPYGRLGTIDPGDLVLVKDVDDPRSIRTFADDGEEHYGMPGEVVIYFKTDTRRGTPIIHRAMTYVTVQGQAEDRTYQVRWHPSWDDSAARGCSQQDGTRVCTFDDDGVTIPSLRLNGATFDTSGFITKGDNVAGNPGADQAIGIYDRPVPPDQIQGIARGELPWFGLIKLTLTGSPGNTADVQDHPYYMTFGAMTAPEDLWVMLVVGLTIVVVAPVGVDYGIHYARRWWETRQADATDAGSNPGHGNPHGPGDPPGPGSPTPPASASSDPGPEDPGHEPEPAEDPTAPTDPDPTSEPTDGDEDGPTQAEDDDRVQIDLE